MQSFILVLYCSIFISWREKDKICICSLVAPRMKKGGWVDASPTGRYYYMFIDHLQFPPPQAQATSHDWWWEKKRGWKECINHLLVSWSWSPQDWWLLCRLLLLLLLLLDEWIISSPIDDSLHTTNLDDSECTSRSINILFFIHQRQTGRKRKLLLNENAVVPCSAYCTYHSSLLNHKKVASFFMYIHTSTDRTPPI
jgi:hypothetical protein